MSLCAAHDMYVLGVTILGNSVSYKDIRGKQNVNIYFNVMGVYV